MAQFDHVGAMRRPGERISSHLCRGISRRRDVSSPPERIDPAVEVPGVVAHHIAKYVFADKCLGEGIALDVGCGVGYGTALLRKSGRFVVGVDVADEAVVLANARYATVGLTFALADGERLPFGDAVFNGITCFEAIEHFRSPTRHIAEVARVLVPHGIYVVSTPRPGTGGSPELNPYHRNEFSASDLLALLRLHFSQVTLLGQRRRQTVMHMLTQRTDILGLRRWKPLRPLSRRISRMIGTEPIETARIEDFVIDARGATSGSEFVAVCVRKCAASAERQRPSAAAAWSHGDR